MFTVYSHEWKELASASATCAHRTAAQTAKSPESPAVWRSQGVAGGRGQAREELGRADADPDTRKDLGQGGSEGGRAGRAADKKGNLRLAG